MINDVCCLWKKLFLGVLSLEQTPQNLLGLRDNQKGIVQHILDGALRVRGLYENVLSVQQVLAPFPLVDLAKWFCQIDRRWDGRR